MLPFRLRVAPRVSLVESRPVHRILGTRESVVGAKSVTVLEILVAVFEYLSRLVLLLELRVIVRVEADLIEVPAEIRGIVIARGYRLHIYLKQKHGKRRSIGGFLSYRALFVIFLTVSFFLLSRRFQVYG